MKAYHATNKEFEGFSNEFMDSNGLTQQLGSGFYFSTDIDNARQYGNNLLLCEIPDGYYFSRYYANEIERNIIVKLINSSPDLEMSLTNYGEVGYEGYSKVFQRAVDTYEGLRYDQFVLDFANDFYSEHIVLFNRYLKELTGYVGVCDTSVYCVFLAEDIKICQYL